jgi:hypothetical protein
VIPTHEVEADNAGFLDSSVYLRAAGHLDRAAANLAQDVSARTVCSA